MYLRIFVKATSTAVVGLLLSMCVLSADEQQPPANRNAAEHSSNDPASPSVKKEAAALVPLNKKGTVLLDRKGKRLLLKTKVELRDGLLEMLLCKTQTKEHESILAVDAKAYVIHTGLLALGAEPGTPVKFEPKYVPPTGRKIDVFLQYNDTNGGPHRVRAQEWIRHATRRYFEHPMEKLPEGFTLPKDPELRYDETNKVLLWYGTMKKSERDALLKLSDDKEYRKAIGKFFKDSQPREMQADFVFAGSRFYVEKKDGQEVRYYQAESGDVICVANFSTAMLDVAMKSTASGENNLMFEAWTERIPPRETEVTVELIPVAEKKPANADEPASSGETGRQ